MKRWFSTCILLLGASTLAACNSAGDVLQPTAADRQAAGTTLPAQATAPATLQAPSSSATQSAAGTTTAPPVPGQSPQIPQAQTSQLQHAGVPAIGRMRLRIAPLVGTSVEAAGPLTERLNAQARQRGITLAGSADASATNVLKGYFSVLTEGKSTTVVYVWDLYDMSGNRLHRINGQQSAPSIAGKQGWAAVPVATMQAVADATVDQLAGWLSGKSG